MPKVSLQVPGLVAVAEPAGGGAAPGLAEPLSVAPEALMPFADEVDTVGIAAAVVNDRTPPNDVP